MLQAVKLPSPEGNVLSREAVELPSPGVKVLARETVKLDGPFCCPGCTGEVFIHKGRVRVHHFAHRKSQGCGEGVGESEEHRRCKEEIFVSLRASQCFSVVELEKYLGDVRADVYFEDWCGGRVAIEVQRSNLSVDEITHRTDVYRDLGIAVLWDRTSPLSV